jgi:hypothetical protein
MIEPLSIYITKSGRTLWVMPEARPSSCEACVLYQGGERTFDCIHAQHRCMNEYIIFTLPDKLEEYLAARVIAKLE